MYKLPPCWYAVTVLREAKGSLGQQLLASLQFEGLFSDCRSV